MSKIRFVFAIASATVFCGLTGVQAQQTTPAQPRVGQQGILKPGTAEQGTAVQQGTAAQQGTVQQGTAQPRVVQPGNPQSTQPVQRDTLPNGAQNNQGERYEARRVPTDASEKGPTVKEAIVQKLLKGNEATIEIVKMAMEKSDNEEVKKLCALIIKDHEACVQKLQQLKGQENQSQQSTQANNYVATVPQELCKISEQACENSLKMTKEMLGKYDGDEFNMAFVGFQCVAHTMMLAELKAIESVGPKELNEVAKDGISKTEKHLEKFKQLAKKLDKDEKKS